MTTPQGMLDFKEIESLIERAKFDAVKYHGVDAGIGADVALSRFRERFRQAAAQGREALVAQVELLMRLADDLNVSDAALGMRIRNLRADFRSALTPDGAGELTDGMIEACAKAMAENAGFAWEACAQSQWRSDAKAGLTAALAQAQEPGEDADKIALDAAHQIEALPNDLHKTQKTGRIQLIILAAMDASSRTEDVTEGYNPADDRMQFPRRKPPNAS